MVMNALYGFSRRSLFFLSYISGVSIKTQMSAAEVGKSACRAREKAWPDIICRPDPFSSKVSSIDTAFTWGTRGCKFESRQYQCSRENWACLKFPWTANCLVRNSRSWSWLRWLNMVWIGYNFPWGCCSPWLMVSHGLVCLGPQWSAHICEVCLKVAWNYKVRGHSTLKINCGFFPIFVYSLPKVV